MGAEYKSAFFQFSEDLIRGIQCPLWPICSSLLDSLLHRLTNELHQAMTENSKKDASYINFCLDLLGFVGARLRRIPEFGVASTISKVELPTGILASIRDKLKIHFPDWINYDGAEKRKDEEELKGHSGKKRKSLDSDPMLKKSSATPVEVLEKLFPILAFVTSTAIDAIGNTEIDFAGESSVNRVTPNAADLAEPTSKSVKIGIPAPIDILKQCNAPEALLR